MRLVFCGRYVLRDIYHRNTVDQESTFGGRHSYPHGEVSEEGYGFSAISHCLSSSLPPSFLCSFLFHPPFLPSILPFFLFLLKEYQFKSFRNATLQTK